MQVAELRYYIINFPNGFSSGFAAALSAENTDWAGGIRGFAFAGSNYIANIISRGLIKMVVRYLFSISDILLQKYACDVTICLPQRYCHA